MKQQNIQTKKFENGLTLIVEPMDDVQSAAVSLLVPAGSVCDRQGQNGSASVLCEWMPRGAGDRDSKQLAAALDNLGVQHSESVGIVHLTFTGATLAENLAQALPIYADLLLRPWLPEDQFEASRSGVEQSLMAIEDEPRQKIMLGTAGAASTPPGACRPREHSPTWRPFRRNHCARITRSAFAPTKRSSASPAMSIVRKSPISSAACLAIGPESPLRISRRPPADLRAIISRWIRRRRTSESLTTAFPIATPITTRPGPP